MSSLGAIIPVLPDRERTILRLYFLGSLTQREVADAIGMSHMRVSRLLHRSCGHLRNCLLAG
ncbi:sigma-70 family RNA polymerase sigma factor [Streptomyces sp. UG1]|uniref:sigma-70 family RNA polymerase sigma factor n=1 Tax=Streptomyces sp. UG1 TaxID=3417652 RepID=UPI003CF2E2AF